MTTIVTRTRTLRTLVNGDGSENEKDNNRNGSGGEFLLETQTNSDKNEKDNNGEDSNDRNEKDKNFCFIGQVSMGPHTLSDIREYSDLQQRRDYMYVPIFPGQE